jgi:hypothetical protein
VLDEERGFRMTAHTGLCCIDSCPTICGSVLKLVGRCAGLGAKSCQGDVSAVRLSKIVYYLVDNIYFIILSWVIGRVQEESGRTAEAFPNWNRRIGKLCAHLLSDLGWPRSASGGPMSRRASSGREILGHRAEWNKVCSGFGLTGKEMMVMRFQYQRKPMSKLKIVPWLPEPPLDVEP